MKVYLKLIVDWLIAGPRWLRDSVIHLWMTSVFHRIWIVCVALIMLSTGSMYGIARWYQLSQADTPFSLGVTFIPSYARYLGVDPKQTLDSLLQDTGVRQFRLTSYWNESESEPNVLNFDELDWQFAKIEANGGKISLSLGLRQPRWPECHEPAWTAKLSPADYQKELNAYITAVVERYKNSPALLSYQLENEALLKDFGTCTDFSRERLVSEYNLVKGLDPETPIILSRSNNLPSWQTGAPQPDIAGMSVYRKVWDGKFTKRYFTYPLPSWYYAFLAGTQKILGGQNTIIHEMQAEPWPADGQGIKDIQIAEQNKTFAPGDLTSRVKFAMQTGNRSADLWGAEYWYYRKVVLKDPTIWNEARQVFKEHRAK